jgi:hypothetical protein
MAELHYGPDVTISLGTAETKNLVEAIAAHASRGGWVTVSDTTGHEWSFLVSPGVPIWINETD